MESNRTKFQTTAFQLNVESNFALWLAQKYCTNQPISCKSKIVVRVFPRFRWFACFYFEFSSSLKAFSFFWLAVVSALVLVLRHSIDTRLKSNHDLLIRVFNAVQRQFTFYFEFSSFLSNVNFCSHPPLWMLCFQCFTTLSQTRSETFHLQVSS